MMKLWLRYDMHFAAFRNLFVRMPGVFDVLYGVDCFKKLFNCFVDGVLP